jgi:hypothetical protein
MTFDFLSETDIEPIQEVALLGMGSLATMKLGDSDGEYQPPADELVSDLEVFLKDAVSDPQRDSDDPIIPNMMSKLYGFSFVWTCGYRWAKNPLRVAYAADVVVSPDERYYLNPMDLVLSFMETGKPSLSQLLIDGYHGNFPESDAPTQMPIED